MPAPAGGNEAVLGGRQPVVKLEPLKADPLKPVAFHSGMSAKQILDACKSVYIVFLMHSVFFFFYFFKIVY